MRRLVVCAGVGLAILGLVDVVNAFYQNANGVVCSGDVLEVRIGGQWYQVALICNENACPDFAGGMCQETVFSSAFGVQELICACYDPATGQSYWDGYVAGDHSSSSAAMFCDGYRSRDEITHDPTGGGCQGHCPQNMPICERFVVESGTLDGHPFRQISCDCNFDE